MGSLITETPYSEITATLEILDRFGVGRDDLRRFRAAAPEVQSHTARIFKTADTCSSISTTSEGERRVSIVRLKQTALGELPAIKTGKCLRGRIWAYRDSDVDSWLPKEQLAQAACNVTAYQLEKPMVFAEMAAVVLGVPATTPVPELGKMLKERGLTLSLSQIDKLVEIQEGGTDVGIRSDGYASFAFMGNADGSVSVAYVRRDDRGWRGHAYPLSYVHRWIADGRLLLRNSDTQTL